MVADGMLTRKRYREVPPRVDYELTERAHELMPTLAELARWGYEWAWSEPRANERVDLGAIFRLAPGLVKPNGTSGTVEFIVTDGKPDGESASYAFSLADDGVSLSEVPAGDSDARVSGNTAAWVMAFSPGHDRNGLAIQGDPKLAELLLSGLALASSNAARAATAA
jgi:hypothetical protein